MNASPPPLGKVLDALHRLYSIRDVQAFPQHLMSIVSELLPTTFISFDQIDLATGAALNVFDRPIPMEREDFMQRWQTYFHEHSGIDTLNPSQFLPHANGGVAG